MQPSVLIVDDDDVARDSLAQWVADRGFEVAPAGDVRGARRLIDEKRFDLALLDLELPDGSGIDLVEPLEETDAEVVIITGHATVETAIAAVRGGAIDYIEKPPDLDRLGRVLDKVRKTHGLRTEVIALRDELRRLGRFGHLVGTSRPMQEIYDLIAKVAPTRSTVLVIGETGSGKEVVAESIHALSRRAKGRFVPVNCGAVAPNLIENELFGHEKGSFTGADRQRKGVFEQASGGTLFLDEITEMSPDLQVKLLRVLETNKITRIGGDREIDIDVRLIAATNRDPTEAVRAGKLREDLKYRLDIFPIHVPPLRARTDDIPMLAQHFLEQLNEQDGGNKSFDPAALRRLAEQPWPGNVRELRNAVERAFILAGDDEVVTFGGDRRSAPAIQPGSDDGTGATGASNGAIRVEVGSSIAKAEKQLILATLEREGGNKKQTAKVLGISLKTLYARLKVYAGGPD